MMKTDYGFGTETVPSPGLASSRADHHEPAADNFCPIYPTAELPSACLNLGPAGDVYSGCSGCFLTTCRRGSVCSSLLAARNPKLVSLTAYRLVCLFQRERHMTRGDSSTGSIHTEDNKGDSTVPEGILPLGERPVRELSSIAYRHLPDCLAASGTATVDIPDQLSTARARYAQSPY